MRRRQLSMGAIRQLLHAGQGFEHSLERRIGFLSQPRRYVPVKLKVDALQLSDRPVSLGSKRSIAF